MDCLEAIDVVVQGSFGTTNDGKENHEKMGNGVLATSSGISCTSARLDAKEIPRPKEKIKIVLKRKTPAPGGDGKEDIFSFSKKPTVKGSTEYVKSEQGLVDDEKQVVNNSEDNAATLHSSFSSLADANTPQPILVAKNAPSGFVIGTDGQVGKEQGSGRGTRLSAGNDQIEGATKTKERVKIVLKRKAQKDSGSKYSEGISSTVNCCTQEEITGQKSTWLRAPESNCCEDQPNVTSDRSISLDKKLHIFPDRDCHTIPYIHESGTESVASSVSLPSSSIQNLAEHSFTKTPNFSEGQDPPLDSANASPIGVLENKVDHGRDPDYRYTSPMTQKSSYQGEGIDSMTDSKTIKQEPAVKETQSAHPLYPANMVPKAMRTPLCYPRAQRPVNEVSQPSQLMDVKPVAVKFQAKRSPLPLPCIAIKPEEATCTKISISSNQISHICEQKTPSSAGILREQETELQNKGLISEGTFSCYVPEQRFIDKHEIESSEVGYLHEDHEIEQMPLSPANLDISDGEDCSFQTMLEAEGSECDVYSVLMHDTVEGSEDEGFYFDEGAPRVMKVDGPSTGRRAVYRCSKCLAPKKGHICPVDSPPNDGASSSSAQQDVLSASKQQISRLNIPQHMHSASHQGLASVPEPVQPSSPPSQSQALQPFHVSQPVELPSNSPILLKLKLATESSQKDFVMSAKWLFSTGLLEGLTVRYMLRAGEVLRTGVVRDGAIACRCNGCKGKQVFNASAFEKHAGSNARHPSDFIFLDNGKCLREVLEAGSRARESGRVMEALRMAALPNGNSGYGDVCTKCGKGGAVNLKCSKKSCFNIYHQECAGVFSLEKNWICLACSSVDSTHHRDVIIPARPVLSHVEPTSQLKSNRDVSLHKALFLPGGLPDCIELGYYIKGQCVLHGTKQGSGIRCSCCNQVVSCSQFEQHAGWGSRRNPYNCIYLSDGRSLHEAALALPLENSLEKPQRPLEPVDNVDFCLICGGGGRLVLCDGCPGAYHIGCAGLPMVPEGDWFCSQCILSTSSRRFSRCLPTRLGRAALDDRLRGQCRQVVKAEEANLGGCVLCRSGEFATGFGAWTIMLCDQCEREFHVGCLKNHGLADLEKLPEEEWFCGKECSHIRNVLKLLVLGGEQPLPGSIAAEVLERAQLRNPDSHDPNDHNFSWQILHGKQADDDCSMMLSQVLRIFSERFAPIVDGLSGQDLIPLMVQSRSIRDQEFGGMYCIVLKRNNIVVSAAVLRIFGQQLSEMPLVATSKDCEGLGYCQALLQCIDRVLGMLHVQKIALPAADGAEAIWVNKFGYTKMPSEELSRLRKELQLMIFLDSSVLEKDIVPLPGFLENKPK